MKGKSIELSRDLARSQSVVVLQIEFLPPFEVFALVVVLTLCCCSQPARLLSSTTHRQPARPSSLVPSSSQTPPPSDPLSHLPLSDSYTFRIPPPSPLAPTRASFRLARFLNPPLNTSWR